MAISVSLILQLFSANVTTIIRFGKKRKTTFQVFFKQSTEERESNRKRKKEKDGENSV